jgi:hypothetical protein
MVLGNGLILQRVPSFGSMASRRGRKGIGMKGTTLFSARVGLCLAAIGLAIITTSASAVQYTFEGETGGGMVMGIQTPNGDVNALVGQFIMTTSAPGWPSPLYTYCTDVGADLATTYNYTPLSLSSAASVGGVAPTWISGGIQNAAAISRPRSGTPIMDRRERM